MSNILKTGNKKMFAKMFELLCKRINICEELNWRIRIFIIVFCFQIIVLGIYHKQMYLSSKQVQNDHIVNLKSFNLSKIFGFGTNTTLGKFYFIPDSRRMKQLYMWKKGKIIQVDASSIFRKPIVKTEGEACNSSSFTFTRPNIASLKSPNCMTIRKELEEFNYFAFKEELDVQIAYSILVYTDYEMMEILLRMIYKPGNTYCLHIDDKSSQAFEKRVRRLAACFENNVFIATKRVKVFWGTFSVLEAEISCMKDLLNKTKSWKYFINLTGQEFPLRTNYEIAKVLVALRGFNNIDCIRPPFKKYETILISGLPPYNLTTYKSPTHVVLTRPFVEYLLSSKMAKAILHWSKKLKIPPDEIAFSTINCNKKLKAPGSFGANIRVNRRANYVARFKIWTSSPICNGRLMRGICTFGPRHLKTLKRRHELFANKFLIQEYPRVPYCLRNILLERTYLEYIGRLDYNVSYYEDYALNTSMMVLYCQGNYSDLSPIEQVRDIMKSDKEKRSNDRLNLLAHCM